MSNGRVPDYTGMLWGALGFLAIIWLVGLIPVVGKFLAAGIVLLVIVVWVVSAFVKASRPRR